MRLTLYINGVPTRSVNLTLPGNDPELSGLSNFKRREAVVLEEKAKLKTAAKQWIDKADSWAIMLEARSFPQIEITGRPFRPGVLYTAKEREIIKKLMGEGLSFRAIALRLNRTIASLDAHISNDRKRNPDSPYKRRNGVINF